LTKPKHLIPVIRTLTDNGMSYPAAETVVNSGYSVRHLKTATKKVRPAPLPKELIAEYRLRYARVQAAKHEANSGRTLEQETGISRPVLSKLRGGSIPDGMSEDDARYIQRRLLNGITARQLAGNHTIEKVRKDLGISYKRVIEISEKVGREVEEESSHKPQWSPVGAFLAMQLSARPQAVAGYY